MRPALPLLLLAACGEPAGPSEADVHPFEPFAWMATAPDTSTRLCAEAADPEGAADKTFIDCAMEGESFAGDEPKHDLVVLSYNLERGHHLDAQIELLVEGADVPTPDVILVSEADRGCDRTGGRHVARDLAEALGMNYVFAVEFTELERDESGARQATCEHGNAILSRYPLGNVRQIRHTDQINYFDADPGRIGGEQERLGGRVAIAADMRVGDRIVHLYTMHLAVTYTEEPRAQQAAEIATEAAEREYLTVAGGDLNSGFFSMALDTGRDIDQTVSQFTSRGFFDSHAAWPRADRTTYPAAGFIVDLILANQDVLSEPGLCKSETCASVSDHYPVWTTVRMD